VPRPRTYDETTRHALIEAGAELLAREGPAGLSVRAVADAVGATTSAIYALFGSKAGLVRAMYVTGFASLRDHLDAVPDTDEPWDDVLALGLAYRASAVADPHLYAVMFGRAVPEFVPDGDDAALALATLDRLRRTVARAAATSLPAGLDVEAATLALWARVHGLASLELAGAFEDRGVELWEATLRADQAGWRTAGPVSAPG
jgi:AcrR family transcriptional regulator